MRVAPKSRNETALAPRGDLRTTPFAELLVTLLDRRITGTLRLLDARGDAHASVFFERGVPVAARTQSAGSTLAQSLIPLCACAEGAYVLVETPELLEIDQGAITGRVDPVALINAAMRGPMREDRVQRVIDALGDREVRLHERTNLERYQLTVPERELVMRLAQGPTTFAELLAESGESERLVRRMFYVLRITRALSLVPAQRNVSGTIDRVVPPSAAPPAQQATDSSGRYHVRYEADAPTDVVSTPARRPLSGSPQARQERELEAEGLYREAERKLRASDYPAALHAAHQALRAYGTARNEALYAWVLALGGGDPAHVLPRALRHLDGALVREPDSIDAHYYKALVLKRGGDDDGAQQHMKRVLRLKPDHVDAARELRIWQMRRRTQSSTGFIAKIFRKTDER